MNWNYERDLMLRLCLADAEPHKVIARRLGCSADAINNRRRHLGIKSGKGWTADMLDALRHGYGRYPDDMLAKTLGKSADAVHRRAIRLGLRKRRAA